MYSTALEQSTYGHSPRLSFTLALTEYSYYIEPIYYCVNESVFDIEIVKMVRGKS